MTNLSESIEAIRKRSTSYDDLTRIKGIGEITQQWLRDTFGVYTFRDLAGVSPVKIENRLKAEGKITARAKIEEWLAQAQMLAEESGEFTLPEAPSAAEQPAWKAVSTFVVIFEERLTDGQRQFQTKAHHMEADTNEAWAGIDPPGLVNWIVAQLGLKGLEAQVAPVITPPEEEVAQPLYSDTLAWHIAKVQQLVGERPTIPSPGALSALPSRPAAQPARQQAPTLPAPTMPTATPFSGRLQQVIAKARNLAGEKDKKE